MHCSQNIVIIIMTFHFCHELQLFSRVLGILKSGTCTKQFCRYKRGITAMNVLIGSKLQSDMKTTKVEELRVQMESFYAEVLRLQQLKASDAPTFR